MRFWFLKKAHSMCYATDEKSKRSLFVSLFGEWRPNGLSLVPVPLLVGSSHELRTQTQPTGHLTCHKITLTRDYTI